jgi:hypothetical protein
VSSLVASFEDEGLFWWKGTFLFLFTISSGPGQCQKCRVPLARGFAGTPPYFSAWLSFLLMVDTVPLNWTRTHHLMHLSLTSFPHNSSNFNSNLINFQFSNSVPASLLPLSVASGLLL